MPPRLGVATTQSITATDRRSVVGSCGLVKWCHDVAAFVALPFFAGSASALVLSNNASHVLALCGSELPSLRVEPFDPELERLVSNWARATSDALTRSNFSASSWTKMLSCVCARELVTSRPCAGARCVHSHRVALTLKGCCTHPVRPPDRPPPQSRPCTSGSSSS